MIARGHDFKAANLRGRDFRGQDLRNCRFAGCDLRDADLRGANLSAADFKAAQLDGADFRGAVLTDAIGAERHGGRLVSIIGLEYPVTIDGRDFVAGCATIQHRGRDSLPRDVLLRLGGRDAVHFHHIAQALLMWYRGECHA